MERTNENAQVIAEYPGSAPEGEAHDLSRASSRIRITTLARKQMRGFGGLISFDVGSLDDAKTVLESRCA